MKHDEPLSNCAFNLNSRPHNAAAAAALGTAVRSSSWGTGTVTTTSKVGTSRCCPPAPGRHFSPLIQRVYHLFLSDLPWPAIQRRLDSRMLSYMASYDVAINTYKALIEDGRWGALLDALEAGGARAGAGFRADEGGLGGRSSAEVAADAVRVAAARGGVRVASRGAELRVGGGGGGFGLSSEGAAASISVAAYDTRSNLTIAVSNNGDNSTDGAVGGGSSLVLRSDASGPAAVHIDASGGGLRADSASGITLAAANGGVALDLGGSGGGGTGGGMFSVLSSGSRTFAVDGATGKMTLAAGRVAGTVAGGLLRTSTQPRLNLLLLLLASI